MEQDIGAGSDWRLDGRLADRGYRLGELRRQLWASSYLRTRALHLSNLFAVLYPDLPNPLLALKDRLPPKAPEVEKLQPMRLVMELLEEMRNPPLVAQRKKASFGPSPRAV